jgi:tryptophan synthase alpha chain
VVNAASGFLYYVSVAGITGGATGEATAVGAAVERLKAAGNLPVVVGFGIKTPEQAAATARLADGVVVGSAIVSLIGEAARTGATDIPARVAAMVSGLAAGVRSARSSEVAA